MSGAVGRTPLVWAPLARQVDLVDGDGAVVEVLTPAADGSGWHSGTPIEHGQAYRFVLHPLDAEGGPPSEPLPDPRSPWQPEGITGPSCGYDPGRFAWTDASWTGGAPPDRRVVYELHVGTFTPEGTLDAAVAHLPDLVDLGVTHVELLPLAEFVGEHGWGYDGVLLWAVHHAYGGPEALQRLVDAAHGVGLGVVLDVVDNHLGPIGNHLPRFGPYLTDAHHTPWGPAVNLDGAGSGPVRAFLVEKALRWLDDFHLDGLRLDAVHALRDDSALPILEELMAAVDDLAERLGRTLWVVAETDRSDPADISPRRDGGGTAGLHGAWADDLHHALHTLLTGESAAYYADYGSIHDLVRALACPFAFQGRWSPARGQVHGRPVPDALDGDRFVVCSQNHDQVGNRAGGERLVHLVGVDGAAVAAAIVACAPAVPLLFQGEEWGASAPFPFFLDPAGDEGFATAVREGRAREFAGFGFGDATLLDATDPATFRLAVLDRGERGVGDHARLHAFYRTLYRLRATHPDLGACGRVEAQVRAIGERGVVLGRGAVVLAANLGPEPLTVDLDEPVTAVLATWLADGADHVHAGDAALALPGRSVAVVEVR